MAAVPPAVEEPPVIAQSPGAAEPSGSAIEQSAAPDAVDDRAHTAPTPAPDILDDTRPAAEPPPDTLDNLPPATKPAAEPPPDTLDDLPPATEPAPDTLDEDAHGDDEWPAPVRRARSPDPDDWSQDAAQDAEPAPPVAPARPSRASQPSGKVKAAKARASSEDEFLDVPTTRVGTRGGAVYQGSFKPPDVVPIPEVPEPGLLNAVRYAISFARAHWQRRSVIKSMDEGIKEDTAALDSVLGTLGTEARALHVNARGLADENQAIDDAEDRRGRLEQALAELSGRQADETGKFTEIEAQRQGKVTEAEAALDAAEQELENHEAQRRGLRDKRKGIERQQKSYLKAAEEREDQAAKSSMGDARAGLRRAAEELRRDAAGLDPERQDLERRITALDRPISQALAKVEALKAELDTARQSLNDAREGHRHRLAELEAERSRRNREVAQANAEIQRRLVTLGTLINLNRIERPEFDALYEQIDELRGAIGARSSEIDRLTAEREAYDRSSLRLGILVLVVGSVVILVLLITLIAILV